MYFHSTFFFSHVRSYTFIHSFIHSFMLFIYVMCHLTNQIASTCIFTKGMFHSPVLVRCTGMLERNILAQFYCSVLNGVFSEHCSFTLKYKSSFRHLESLGNSVRRWATSRITWNSQNMFWRTWHIIPKYSIDLEHVQSTWSSERNTPKEWRYGVKPSILGKLIENRYFSSTKNILHINFCKVRIFYQKR